MFEKLGKSRTFLIISESSNDLQILAYFTIGLQVLRVPNELLSGRQTRQLDGFSSKLKGIKITEFPTILIGQIAKNDSYNNSISGTEIMHYCLATILEGQARLGLVAGLFCWNVKITPV